MNYSELFAQTKKELLELAAKLQIVGRHSLNKEDLISRILQAIDSSEVATVSEEIVSDAVEIDLSEVEIVSDKICNQDVVIFHKKSELFWCPDGVTSAAIMKWKFPHIECFLGGNYSNNSEIIEKIGTGNKIYFVDYSMRELEMNSLACTNEIIIIDHHKTAQENLSRISNPLISKYFDMGKSGARLTWEYCFPDTDVPAIIQYIEAGDLYTFNLPEAKKICAGIYTLMHYSFDLEQVFFNIANNFELYQEELIQKFSLIGEQSNAERKLRVAEYLDKAYPKCIKGHSVLVVEYSEYDQDLVSYIGAELYKSNPDKDFIAIIQVSSEICYVSFRSSGFDCSDIAKSFGGGGHPQACGCTVKKLADLFD